MNGLEQQKENSQGFSNTLAILKKYKSLFFGFVFFWVWVWATFQTKILFPFKELSGLDLYLAGWALPLIFYALGFVILAIVFKVFNVVPHGKFYFVTIPLAMGLGALLNTLLLYGVDPQSQIGAIIAFISAILTGIATAFMHTEYGRIFGKLGPRKTVVFGIAATLGAAITTAFLMLLPLFITAIIIIFLPILSALLSFKLYKSNLEKIDFNNNKRNRPLNIPRKFLATSFLQGSALGIVQIMGINLLSGAAQMTYLMISGFAVAAIILHICAINLHMDFNRLIYQVGFLILAFGFVVLAISRNNSQVAFHIQFIGYRVVDITMWTLCVYLIYKRRIPTNWVFTITTCALIFGQAFGVLLITFFSRFLLTIGDMVTNFSILSVFILLGAALIFSDYRNVNTGWGMVRPGDPDYREDVFEYVCKSLAAEFELTEREEEVFSLLADNITRKEVAKALDISIETVKTHVRNIYNKMDIHSQDELNMLVESHKDEVGTLT